jgi:hypothetical protein
MYSEIMRTLILCIVLGLVFTSCSIYYAAAHELTPTYPEIKESHIPNVYVVKLETYNRREEVRFYEIQVYDKDMEPIVFATTEKIIDLPHLSRKNFSVYIRKKDVKRAVYVCTVSKLNRLVNAEQDANTVISSRVCSKIK